MSDQTTNQKEHSGQAVKRHRDDAPKREVKRRKNVWPRFRRFTYWRDTLKEEHEYDADEREHQYEHRDHLRRKTR